MLDPQEPHNLKVESMDMWELLREGRNDEALQAGRDAFAVTDSCDLGLAVSLTAICMWLRRWDEAWTHIHALMENRTPTYDFSLKIAGTAKWCAGDRNTSIAEWRKGLKVKYADAGGGVTVPLHLYFASAIDPSLMPTDEAIALLEKCKKSWLYGDKRTWPTYLVRLVLGEQSTEEVHREAATQYEPHERPYFAWEIDFWAGVRRLAEGDQASFCEAMRSASQQDWGETDEDHRLFIEQLRSGILFLARCEYERLSSN